MPSAAQYQQTAIGPAAPKRLDLWFQCDGTTDPSVFSPLITSVTRLTDASSGPPFYRILLAASEDIDTTTPPSIHCVATGYKTDADGNALIVNVHDGLDPTGSDARQAGLEVDVVVRQVAETALLTALDTAINAGEAAVSAGDGGAAALAAIEASLDTYRATIGSTSGATNSVAAGTTIYVELQLDIGTAQ